MATVPYVSYSPWWSASNLNTLCGEFDRRLTLALAGKTPYLLANYGVGDQSLITSDDRRFHLPISQYSGDPVVEGVEFPKTVMGAVYAFKGSADGVEVVYFARTNSFDQGAMDTDAAAATEVSHDTTAKIVVVDDTSAAISLEWSLKALRRTVSSVSCWLVPQTTSSRRAMRRHRYAVAELVLEAIAEFTVPRSWDRYGCFRIHNLSAIEVTVTVETYEADGTTAGTSHTVTVPKFGCRAFRREPGYYDDSLNYFWKARAGLDKRFYQPAGQWVVEQSAKANNIAHPNIIADWLEILGAQRDPYVDPPDEGPRYAELFGDTSDPTTLVHDLIAHKGAAKVIGWDVSSAPAVQTGTIGDSSTLTADLAAIGITLTVVGDTYQLDRDDATAPGEDASGLDLFAVGSNLMWLQAQTVTVPGHTPFSRAQVQRQYSTLPVTLVENVPVGALVSPAPSGFTATAITSTSYTRSLYGGTSPSITVSKLAGSAYSGSDWTVTRLSEIGDAADEVDGAYSTVTAWQLTPFGFASQFEYSFTFSTTLIASGVFEPMNGGIYDRWSGTTIARKSWVHIKSPGWSLGSLKPTRHRSFGKQLYDASGPTFWSTEDWSGILSDTDGKEPTATGKVLIEAPELRYLSDITGDTVGDVYDVVTLGGGGTGPIDITETRYRVRPDSDEARSASEEIVETRRVQYNEGTPTLDGGEEPFFYYHRRPMQIEDYNSLAWMVNGWTRTVPLVTIKNLWLKRTDDGGYPGFYIPDFYWESDVFPKNAAFYIVPGSPVTAWSKSNWATLLPVMDREDQPNWTDAKAASGHTKYWPVQHYTWYRGKFYDPGTGFLMATRTTILNPLSPTNSRSGAFTGSYFDKDDVDAAFAWFTTEDVAALASDKGLPYVHLTWGTAMHLGFQDCIDTLPAPIDGSEFDSWIGPASLPLTDNLVSEGTIYINSPNGYADHVPALTSDEFEYIVGGAYSVDANGRPIVIDGTCYNRGDATLSGNSYLLWTCNSDPNLVIDPYYDPDFAQGMSESKWPLGINLQFSGYTGSAVNSRLLLGNCYTRALSTYNPFTNAKTGGSWSYNSSVDTEELAAGITYYLPPDMTEQPARLIANLYVDLT